MLGTSSIKAGEEAAKAHKVYDDDSGKAAKSLDRGQVASAEQNPESQDTDEGASVGQTNQGLYRPNKAPIHKQIGVKRWRVWAFAIGLIIGSATSFFSILKGPLELLQLGSILGRFTHHSDSVVAQRTKNLFRYSRAARSGDIGETRVGIVGSKIFHLQEQKLGEIGITFDRTDPRTGKIIGTGTPRGIEIDPSKHPELKDLSLEEARSAAAEKWRGEWSIKGDKIRLDMTESSIHEVRLFTNTAIEELGDGKILTWMSKRIFAKYFRLPKWFHPIEKIKAAFQRGRAETGITKFEAEQEKQTELENAAEVKEALPEKFKALDRVKDKIEGHSTLINIAAFATIIACEVRDLAHDVPDALYAAVNGPAQRKAGNIQSTASQVRSGEDITLGQAGAKRDSLINDKGQGPWAAKPINALEYGGAGVGIEIPDKYKVAFTLASTSLNILHALGDNGVTKTICSTPGKLIQLGIGVVLLVFSFGESGWANATAEAGLQAVVLGGFIKLAHTGAMYLLTTDPVKSFAGAVGGGLLAYGSRALATSDGLKLGFTALPNTDNKVTLEEDERIERQEFQRKSLFARLFDVRDYRSLTASTVRSGNTNPAKAVSTLASSFLRGGDLISKLASGLWPKARAAEESYDWGTPIVGIPNKIMDDPQYGDAYDNAGAIARILDRTEDVATNPYTKKMNTCFGTVPVKDKGDKWNIAGDHVVDMKDDAYQEAHCDDYSDPTWIRFTMFNLDSNIATNTECYKGDKDACQLMFYGTQAIQKAVAGGAIVGGNNGPCPTGPVVKNGDGVAIDAQGHPVEPQQVMVEKTHVNGCIADQFGRMVAAARGDGVDLTGGGGFRTLESQIALRRAHCGTSDYDIYQKSANDCSPPTARPGTSMHNLGLAIDFQNCSSHSTACWQWLNAHAATYGFTNLSTEPWHWSTTGH